MAELTFKKIVILGCLIVLVITLIILAFAIKNRTNDMKWPPYVANCPDYWLDLSSDGSQCYNKKSLGTCNIPSSSDPNYMNFTSSAFTGSEGQCNKKKWATNCGLTWDGITYGYGKNDPCS